MERDDRALSATVAGDVPAGALVSRRSVVALLGHPSLWWTAVRQAFVLAVPGWWRRWPPLPLPDAAYLRFRLQTAYGGEGTATPDPDDLVAYLRWCRRTSRMSGSAS